VVDTIYVLRSGFDTDTGDKVRFQGSNIFLPGAAGCSAALSEEPELEGTIVGFSDLGPKPRYFAVIEVVMRHSLIVPVEKLEVVKTASRKPDS
jgi:hypothetical protein